MDGVVRAGINVFSVAINLVSSLYREREHSASLLLELCSSNRTIQMWNVFDSAFIVITALYLVLRVKGLSSGNREF